MTTTPVSEYDSPQRLRELTDEDFRDRYHCDRFTATVLANRFQYVVQHMCTGLLTRAFSTILRDWYDFAATVSGPPTLDYPMAAVSNSQVLFLGTMAEGVRNMVEEYGASRLGPGDVLICNDPYRIGTHVNDVCFVRPVFSSDELVGFVNLQPHLLDMGGTVPGGFSGTKRNVYETGLVLGPMLLYRADGPVRETWSLIFDNCRYGEQMLPDIKTVVQNLRLGESLLAETADRYGNDELRGAMRYACDVSADRMATALEQVADGSYTGESFIDCDGIDDSIEYRIAVSVKIAGSRAEVDLSGTSPQARTCINSGWLDAKTAVGGALKFLLDPRGPFTSGTYRDIDIVVPPGTVMSALPPDGAIFLYWEGTEALLLAIFKALCNAVGSRAIAGDFAINIHSANGVHSNGVPWVTSAQCGGEHGPWGATEAGDGGNYNVSYLNNNLDPATEAIESDFPVVIWRKEYVTDMSGAGYNRGGSAVVKDTEWRTEAEHYSMALRSKHATGFGVLGGKSGPLGGAWVWNPETLDQAGRPGLDVSVYGSSQPVAGMLDPDTLAPDADGQYFYFARVPIWRTKPGVIFRYLTAGAGGWGDPLTREPERVLGDVRDEYISIEQARDQYGVVVTGDVENAPEELSVDVSSTEELRAAKAAAAAGAGDERPEAVS